MCFEFPLGRTWVAEGIYQCAIVSFDLYIFYIRMVVRICSDVVASANVEMYLEELRDTVIPIYSTAAGLVSVFLLRRQLVAYGELAVVSVWKSHDAMAAFFEQRLPINAALQHTVIRREPITYDFLPAESDAFRLMLHSEIHPERNWRVYFPMNNQFRDPLK